MTSPMKVRLLYLVAFTDLFACSMAVPLLSIHLRSLGISHFTIGILNSLYAGLQLVSGPIIGSWSDIRGHSFVLKLSLLLCSILYFVLGAVTAVPVITITRIGLGLLKHTQTLSRTLLTDVACSTDQLKVQSHLVSFGGVGFMVGPIIGGHLAELKNGFHYVCCIVMLFFWINFAIVFFFPHNTQHEHKDNNTIPARHTEGISDVKINTRIWTNEKGDVHESFRKARSGAKFPSSDIFLAASHLWHVNWSVYWDIFTLKFLLGFAQAIHYQNFSLILKEEYGIAPSGIGYTISFQGLIGTTAGFLTAWMGKFYKNDNDHTFRMLHGFGVLALSFVSLSLATNLTFFIVCLIPLSASSSVLRIVTSEVILRRTESDQRGSLIGSGQSMSSVARLIAPFCSGLAYEMFGSYGISLLTTAVTAAAVALCTVLCLRQRKKKLS